MTTTTATTLQWKSIDIKIPKMSISICLFDDHKLKTKQICFYIFHSQFVCVSFTFWFRYDSLCVHLCAQAPLWLIFWVDWHSTWSSCRHDFLMCVRAEPHTKTNRRSTKPFFLISFLQNRINWLRMERKKNVLEILFTASGTRTFRNLISSIRYKRLSNSFSCARLHRLELGNRRCSRRLLTTN